MKRYILLLLFLALFLEAKVIKVEQLFNKKTTLVKEESLFESKSFYGKTKIDESLVQDVVTRFDGYITSLNANKKLMEVKKNQVLFSLYSDELALIQDELQIARAVNKGLYRSTLNKLKRFDLAKSEVNKIKRNKITARGVNVYASSNAYVLKKMVNKNSFVKKGTLIMQVANFDKLWFIAQVYQKDLAFLKKGMEAKIYIDGKSTAINSKLDYIYPFIDEKNKTIDVRFIIDNKDLKVFPNMFANVKIKSETKTRLTLPKTAVLNKGSKFYVFKVLSKDEFEPVKVEVKRISSSKYEILDGLQKGEKVINDSLFLLDSDAITNALYEEGEDDDW